GVPLPVAAQEAPPPGDDRLRRLEAQMASQQAELTRLRSELVEATRRQAEERAAAEASARAAAASRLSLSLTGFVQIDSIFRQSSEDQINGATGDPLNEDRFLVRRARLRANLDYGLVAGALELDGNTVRGTTARLIGAEASLRWPGPPAAPYVMATLGLFKTPFGFEVLQSDRDRLFLERSTVVRALFPGEYDVGGRVQGS